MSPDLDGDGRDDVTIGARSADAGAGAVFVLTSPLTGGLLGDAPGVLTGAVNDVAGAGVFGGGDLTGDGTADRYVSASTNRHGYVVDGAPLPIQAGLPGVASHVLEASLALACGATTLDFDADGVADLLLLGAEQEASGAGSVFGVPLPLTEDLDPGQVFLFLGGPTW